MRETHKTKTIEMLDEAKTLFAKGDGKDYALIARLENEITTLLTTDWTADTFDYLFSAFYIDALTAQELADLIENH